MEIGDVENNCLGGPTIVPNGAGNLLDLRSSTCGQHNMSTGLG
jgi:hypothetical protein